MLITGSSEGKERDETMNRDICRLREQISTSFERLETRKGVHVMTDAFQKFPQKHLFCRMFWKKKLVNIFGDDNDKIFFQQCLFKSR